MKSFIFYSREHDQFFIRCFRSEARALKNPFYIHLAFIDIGCLTPVPDETTKINLDFVFIGEL